MHENNSKYPRSQHSGDVIKTLFPKVTVSSVTIKSKIYNNMLGQYLLLKSIH